MDGEQKNHQLRLVFGHIINPISDSICDVYMKGAMLLTPDVDGNYIVSRIGHEDESWVKDIRLARTGEQAEVYNFRGQIIAPTFFDTHFHWVQDEVRLKPKDSLLEWLSEYAWPCEKQFASATVSEEKAKHFFKFLSKVGTLGGAMYSSLHETALESAYRHMVGDFVVGNVLMTMNSPDYLSQSEENAYSLMERFCSKYGARYAVTPRFAPTTHPDIMRRGGELARHHNSFIQTHLSENLAEVEYVLSLYSGSPGFEKVQSYTEIYHKVGLLGPRTILGHAIHLSDNEWEILSQTQTNIAHCPTSNAPVREGGLGSGLFNYIKADSYGISWALGSDIGGGPYPCMWDVIRSFVSHNKRAHREVSYTQGLFRSTCAGAKILGMDKMSGNLLPGKFANFIVMDWPHLLKKTSSICAEDNIEKLIKSKSSRDSWDEGEVATFYKGKIVYEKDRQLS